MTPVTSLGRLPRLPLLECVVSFCACRRRVTRCARDVAGLEVYEAGVGGPRIMWDDVLNEWGPSGKPPTAGPTKCECGSAAVYGTGSSAHSDWCPASEAR